MYEYLMRFIEFIGYSNFITIATFIIASIFSYYGNFKGLYRLIYSQSSICPNAKSIFDWQNKEAIFLTRVLFYNNGRKTLFKNAVRKLEIISSGDVSSYKVLKGEDFISINKRKNNIKLRIKRLDKSKFVLIEITHKGSLSVNGEIIETGELLNTETKPWIILNFISFIIVVVLGFLYLYILLEATEINMISGFINILLFILSFYILRYMNSLFFIPDSIADKYLEPTDKFRHSFKDNK